jgi:hypothetical protein
MHASERAFDATTAHLHTRQPIQVRIPRVSHSWRHKSSYVKFIVEHESRSELCCAGKLYTNKGLRYTCPIASTEVVHVAVHGMASWQLQYIIHRRG